MSRFNDYLTFITIVETRSITEAANKLHRSVSAVSKQLSRFEDQLAVRLIERSTQSLSVTEIGENFYIKCKEVLASVEHAEQTIKDELIAPSGKITLSFPEVLLRSPLMDLLNDFCKKYPSITLDLSVSNQVEDIIENQTNFAFRMGKLNDSRLTAVALNKALPILCASPNYISNKGVPMSYDNLFVDHRLILPNYLNLSEQVRRFFLHSEKLPISLQNAHTSDSEAVLYHAVLGGLGVGVMLDFSIAEDIKTGRLINIFPHDDLPELELYLIYHNSKYMPEKLRVFKAFIKDNYDRLGEGAR